MQGWYSDIVDTTVISVIDGAKLHVTKAGKCHGFFWEKCRNATFVSMYLLPIQGIATSCQKLEKIEDFIRGVDGEAQWSQALLCLAKFKI